MSPLTSSPIPSCCIDAITIKDSWFGGDSQCSHSLGHQVSSFIPYVVMPDAYKPAKFAAKCMFDGEVVTTSVAVVW